MSRYTSDQSLAEGLHAGRRDAFEHLYAEQHAAIYNLCARILGDRQEAEDVTHDASVTAFTDPPPATEDVRVRPWLYRVATNACLNRLRARKHTGGDGELIAAVPDAVDSYQRAETVALVEASLAGMNDRYRAALVLKDLHGLAPTEIAEVMDVSRPAADVLVHRARGAFKAAFTRLGGSAPAPADLALVLAPLGVPAALQAAPSLPHVAPAAHAPQHAIPPAAGPAGAGLLGKIGASLAAKIAIGAAVTAVVVGGGVTVVRREQQRGTSASSTASAPAQTVAGVTFASAPLHLLKTRWGAFDWRDLHDLHQIEQWCAGHGGSTHHQKTGHHGTGHDGSAGAGHDHAAHASAGGGSHADGDGAVAQSTHDASSGSSATTHDAGGGSSGGTSTHDGGDGAAHGGDD